MLPLTHQSDNIPGRNRPDQPITSPPQGQRGFTLIELVMVMIIVSLLATIAISRWSASPFNLAAQAEQLLSDIRYTQTLAMTHGQRYRINFSTSSYTLSNLDGTSLIPHPATGDTTTLLVNGITLTFSHTFLVFNGIGAPYSDATSPGTALAANATITLNVGADSRTLQISPETGRAILL